MKKRHDNFQQVIDECRELAEVGNYIFRGTGKICVLNEDTVQSSLYRQYDKNSIPCKDRDFFKIERDIISQARYIFDPSDTYIQMLTELRHFGDDLAIIDFTRDPYVALFFACRFSLNDRDEEGVDKDGEVILLVTPEIKTEIDYDAENYYAIEPTGRGTSANRVSAQSSIFIHTRWGCIDPDDPSVKIHPVRVESEFKAEIVDYLQNKHKINLQAMFKDVVGYIQYKKHINPLEYRLGVTVLELRDFDNAFAQFDSVIKDNPHSFIALVSRGIAWYGIGKPDKAIDDYSRAIQINPGYDLAYINRGNAKYNIGDIHGAFHDLSKAIELNPNNADAILTRGCIHVEKKNFKDALADSYSALKIVPKSSEAIYLCDIAKINLSLRKGQQNDDATRKVIREFLEQGEKHIKDKDYNLAIEEFNKALDIDAAILEAYMLRGEAKFKNDEFDGSTYDFNLAVNLIKSFSDVKMPELTHSLSYLGLAKIRKFDFIGAVDTLSELLELKPSDAVALTARGLAFYSLGIVKEKLNDTSGAKESFKKALVDLDKATGLDPNSIEAMHNRALVNQSLGNAEQATKDFLEYECLKEKFSPEENS